MVVVLQDCKGSSCSSGSYDEEIILEGPNADLSRISRVVHTVTDELVPCMRLKREISSFDSSEELILEDQSSSEGETKLEVDNKSYNAFVLLWIGYGSQNHGKQLSSPRLKD